MTVLLLAFGLVFVIEGLALALAPSRLETLLAVFSAMPREQRQRLGLLFVAIGAGIAALAKWLGV